MKRYAKPMTALPAQKDESDGSMMPPPPMSEISITRLIDDGLVALYREMKNLLTMSSKGKLDAAGAKDLRDHMKLLFELRKLEEDSLKDLNDEELQARAKATLNNETKAETKTPVE